MSDIRLKYLFNRFIDKTATTEEREEFFAFIDNDGYENEINGLLQEYWLNAPEDRELSSEKANAILKNILAETLKSDPEPRSLTKKWMYSIAASVIFVLFFGGYQLLIKDKAVPTAVVKNQSVEQTKDFLPGGNKAVLTLGDGRTIVLDDSAEGILASEGSISVRKTRDGQLIYSINKNVDAKQVSFNTISTPRGGQYQVILPDGSKVWLNSASSLRFPTLFAGKERKVEMQGEAYFEIAKDASKPFIVAARATEVKVYGTHFNVMAYEDEEAQQTTLLEGSVKVSSGSKSNMLVPGEQAVISKNSGIRVTDKVNLSEVVAWKNGYFEFKDANIEVIMRQISRWYDVKVKYQGDIPAEQFTGKISRKVNASELLKMLEYAGVKFKTDNQTIIVSGTY
jgi:hypothetical protein